MLDLFDDVPQPDIDWRGRWLSRTDADDLLQRLIGEVAWQQDHMRVPGGAEIALPRLTAWQGEPEAVYIYSGIKNVPAAWTPAVLQIKAMLERELSTSFNSVLLNRYRTGQDSIGWHADDERELGPEPVIASISLGAERAFELRHNKTKRVVALALSHGSLLVMKGRTQKDWKHQVPKDPKLSCERLNLTFRRILVG